MCEIYKRKRNEERKMEKENGRMKGRVKER
jgi:hypothetical protein